MAEYIGREAAIKAIKNADCDAIADGAESYDLSYLKEIFFNIPAADVVPVVHGTWIEKKEETYCPVLYGEDAEPILHKYTRYICNLCGRSCTVPEPYCHCGAKMDDEPIPFAEIDETRRKYEAFCREKGYNDE